MDSQYLIDTVAAVRLKGCEVVLTGVRPNIARTLVSLGVDLSGIRTVSKPATNNKPFKREET